MSARTYSKAVCRKCGHEWPLRKTYGQDELIANLNEGERLSLCPACGSVQVSYPYDDPSTAPAEPEIVGGPKVTRIRVDSGTTDRLPPLNEINPLLEEDEHEPEHPET